MQVAFNRPLGTTPGIEGYTVDGIKEKLTFNTTTTTAVNYYIPKIGNVNTARIKTNSIELTTTSAVFPFT